MSVTISLRPSLFPLILTSCLAACGGQTSGRTASPVGPTLLASETHALQRFVMTAASGPTIGLDNLGGVDQAGAPLTFGQVFAAGHFRPAQGQILLGILDDGTRLPLQVDVKATHADGSVRHAVVSALAPSLPVQTSRTLTLVAARGDAAAQQPGTGPSALLDSGFSARVELELDGRRYSASAAELLRAGQFQTWLTGPVAAEWHVAAPLATAEGRPHPHLSARFAIRSYGSAGKARVDVTIENNWAYEPAPQNFQYDVRILVGGQPVYEKDGLNHYHHARWRKLAWWGATPQVHVRHDSNYLIDTRALPNYDRALAFPEATLNALATAWTGPRAEPMGSGMAAAYMPGTGGRPDIGLLPGWAATYLLSMDRRAKDVTLGTADLAGSWSSHYRDRQTDRPVMLKDYPYMTILGNPGDTYNPATRQREAFPSCATPTACTSNNRADTSHQPGFAYLPYLVTGDYYYLEELQFWAAWNSFSSNPAYREHAKGLFKSDQVRGQAWSLRTLAQAAYITPDSDVLKEPFRQMLNHNLNWYSAAYPDHPEANALGVIVNGYAVVYKDRTGLAPWMDDFFTSAVGHALELGFDKAAPLLDYKAQFPVQRMVGEGSCWITGAIYALTVRDSAASPYYTSMGQAYAASHTSEFKALPCAGAEMAAALKLKQGEMTGYSASPMGFPSNMQPALAYATASRNPQANAAWSRFMERSVKPDYSLSPQFAIVPRTAKHK